MKENAVTYDYKTLKVKREMETIVCDAYENLGWELTSSSTAENSIFQVNLSFKRNRKIENKMELLKLQEKLDSCLMSIESLQAKKKSAGSAEAVTTGVAAALVFGGGMSMSFVLSGVGYLVGGIVLGVAGIGLGFLAWLIYKKVKKKKLGKIQPLLESEFDKLSDICEQAGSLL